MATTPTPKAKADVRQSFVQSIKDLAKQSAAIANAAENAGQRVWSRPSGWNGDLKNLDAISAAFDRQQNNQDFINAIKDATQPGTVGDLEVSQIQIDYVAAQERAFRARHCSRLRRSLHAAARKDGHGVSWGVLNRGVLGYVTGIAQSSADTTAGA